MGAGVEKVTTHPSLGQGCYYAGVAAMFKKVIKAQVSQVWRGMRDSVSNEALSEDEGKLQAMTLDLDNKL